MRIYLDTCCLNRPFDDQNQDRIRLESEAIRLILQHVESGEFTLIGSEILRYEIAQIPDEERRIAIGFLLDVIHDEVAISPHVIRIAEQLEAEGFDTFDAIHLACDSEGKVDVFLTVDDRLYNMEKKAHKIIGININNPMLWIRDWKDIVR